MSGSDMTLILSLVQITVFLLICYWQFLFAAEDFQLFAPAAPVLPVLIGEARQWFSRRFRSARLSQFCFGFKHRCFFPPARSVDFLLLRDGWFTAGIFKTPARHNIPPPPVA
ncbi:MAG: hypothetical protein ONB46_24070 [candidate division KSB1 bacterium]|nr:hypothetical protein [candidate division KSB1 bacterium]MDZ7368943.1 hypothetical protein [candidate division KSB1 bacterium]